MSGTVCSLLPDLDARSYHLHDRLPVEYPVCRERLKAGSLC
jgi:hypothetical protein